MNIDRCARYHPAAYRWIGEMLLGRGAKADDFGAVAKRTPVLGLEVMGEDGSLTRPRLIRERRAHEVAEAVGNINRWRKMT